MANRLFATSILGVLAACGHKADVPDCDVTITDAFRRIASDSHARPAAELERSRLTMISSCSTEHWSAEALSCIATASLDLDLAACTEKLTHEQFERLNKKLLPPTGPTGVDVDAGVTPVDAVTIVDAPVTDAAVDAVRSRLPSDASTKPVDKDCSKTIVDPRDRRCRAQFCRLHTTDARCEID